MSKFMDDIVGYMENPIASFMIRRKRGPELFNTLKNHLYPISKLENYKLEYGDRITRGAPCVLIFHGEKGAEAHTDNSLIYATYAMLAAHSLGLGAAMIEIVAAAINRVPEVRKMFRIPDDHESVMSLILGYPKYIYKRAIKRENQTIHWVA
jgi:nitroreductase